jgi:hypothetical protein
MAGIWTCLEKRACLVVKIGAHHIGTDQENVEGLAGGRVSVGAATHLFLRKT